MDEFEDNIFHNDPVYMRSLIGKTVKVDTLEKISHIGTVFVIDPIYKTIVLHPRKTTQNRHDVVFILHHAIKSLEILSQDVDDSYLEKIMPKPLNNNTVLEKKRLKKWLEQMFINVDETGDYLKIDDHLIILPPYAMDNCICNNTIVLEKIRNIISMMPDDFN